MRLLFDVRLGDGRSDSRTSLRPSLHLSSSPSLVTSPCLVHWDAWAPNFFIKDGTITGIIDFERTLWAEPLMEAQFRALYGEGGVNAAMRGYGKTTFTFSEEQRNQLYSLHLALTMNIECYYRNYDTNDIFNLSRQLIAAAMAWLQANP